MPFATVTASLPIALFSVLLATAVYTDLREYRIPNAITFAIAALFPAQVLVPGAVADPLGALLVAAAVLAVGTGLFAFGYLGGGDVKLLAAVSLWVGPRLMPEFLLGTGLAGGVLALFQMTQWRFGLAIYLEHWGGNGFTRVLTGRDVPYAAAIAAGAFIALSA